VQRFRAKLEPVPHGGQYVVVPAAVADGAGLKHGARVRGEVNGVGYRSALMKYRGIFHLGVHKATLETAAVKPGARVSVTIDWSISVATITERWCTRAQPRISR